MVVIVNIICLLCLYERTIIRSDKLVANYLFSIYDTFETSFSIVAGRQAIVEQHILIQFVLGFQTGILEIF